LILNFIYLFKFIVCYAKLRIVFKMFQQIDLIILLEFNKKRKNSYFKLIENLNIKKEFIESENIGSIFKFIQNKQNSDFIKFGIFDQN
jgi:hypothetical protein